MTNGLLNANLTKLKLVMIMKVKQLFFLSTVLFLAGINTTALAQCKELKWPEDRKKADECVAVYTDAMKQGNYRAATGSLQWMLTNAPNWNTKMYIDGTDIYDKLADKEADPAKKKILVDSLLMLFDMRIKNCGDEANVLNRKEQAEFKYNQKIKEKLPDLLAHFDKIYELSGNNVSDNNLGFYMSVIKNYQTLYKNLTDDQILHRYDKLSAVLDDKMKKATEQNNQPEVDKLKAIKEKVDADLITMVKVDCDFVRKNLAPRFKQNPNDVNLAKKIFKFMLDGKCTDDPLWLEAGEAFYKLTPEKDFGLLKALAVKNMQIGNYEKAETLLNEALAMKLSQGDKAEAQLYLGAIEAKKNNYPAARDLFRQAATNPSTSKDAWEKIGDLYYNSFDNCSKRVNQAEDRLVFIAAYDMYQKAGNAQLMSRAKAQFPSKEDIFLLNWTVGTAQKVGCWINETVVLKTRD